MDKSLQLAWRNLWRNWRRTGIALTAIVLGLLLLLFFDGLYGGLDDTMYGNAVRLYGGNIQIHAPGYRVKANRLPLLPLDNADEVVQAIADFAARADPDLPHVVAAGGRIQTGGLIASREGSYPVVITGIEPAVEASFSLQAEHVTAGRFLQPGDGDVVLVGEALARRLEAGIGDRVTLLGKGKHATMRQRTMTIIGIYSLGVAQAEQSAVFISLAEAQSLYDLHDQVTEVAVTLDRIGGETAVITALRAALPAYEVDSWATLEPGVRRAMQTEESYMQGFAVIILFIAAIGILNLMLMAVFERTREMGVLAALGMKRRRLMGLFVLEGAFIGLVGAVIGALLGTALIWAINRAGGIDISAMGDMGEFSALMGDRLYPAVETPQILLRMVTVVFIAFAASLYPAWLAARREPAEALRHV
ncbi:MAG: ABC transporter permease [Caldilineaceae bacterium]|nr:ABC transporter permease [Caldilineaceae bacterium]